MRSNDKIRILSANKSFCICMWVHMYTHTGGWKHTYKTLNSDSTDMRNWKGQRGISLFTVFLFIFIISKMWAFCNWKCRQCLGRSAKKWKTCTSHLHQPLVMGTMPWTPLLRQCPCCLWVGKSSDCGLCWSNRCWYIPSLAWHWASGEE